jgi:hypothetical protein
MASSTYMTAMTNCINDVQRESYADVKKALAKKNLLTDEIEAVLNNLTTSVKANKKIVKKQKMPRFSGYHLFMKEHRITVKEEQPDITPQQLTSIVSKAWKDIDEDKKQEFNNRALKMKEEYLSSNDEKSGNSSSDTESETDPETARMQMALNKNKPKAEPKTEKKPTKKAEKKPKKAEKKPKKAKKAEKDSDESDVDI